MLAPPQVPCSCVHWVSVSCTQTRPTGEVTQHAPRGGGRGARIVASRVGTTPEALGLSTAGLRAQFAHDARGCADAAAAGGCGGAERVGTRDASAAPGALLAHAVCFGGLDAGCASGRGDAARAGGCCSRTGRVAVGARTAEEALTADAILQGRDDALRGVGAGRTETTSAQAGCLGLRRAGGQANDARGDACTARAQPRFGETTHCEDLHHAAPR